MSPLPKDNFMCPKRSSGSFVGQLVYSWFWVPSSQLRTQRQPERCAMFRPLGAKNRAATRALCHVSTIEREERSGNTSVAPF